MSLASYSSRPGRFAWLWLLLALGWLPTVSRAYVLEGSTWDWDTQIVLNLQLGTPPRTLIDGSTTWNQVAVAAMQEWNQYLGGGVRFSSNETATTPQQNDNVNSVAFSSTVFGETYGGDTLAVTLLRNDQSTTREADVLVNTSQIFDSYRGALHRPNPYDLRRVLLHEFGHVLGLGHAIPLSTAIMAPIISDFDTLQVDDITGLVALYGTPTGLPLFVGSLDLQATVNQPFSYKLAAVGGVTSKSLTGLPPGLFFDQGTGLISGTPTQLGTYALAVTATNDRGTTSVTLTLSVVGPPTVAANTAVTAIVGSPLRFQIAATGSPTQFAYSSTPFGLTYDTHTGLISGTPTADGQATVSYTVTNVAGSASGSLAITVQPEYTMTVLRQGTDPMGFSQNGPLLAGADGNLYWANLNLEAILQITPSGNTTVLHTFAGADGTDPGANLVRTDDGTLYGTTNSGGANLSGTVFRIAPNGVFTTLYNFSREEGGSPYKGLVQGHDGNLYGLKAAPGLDSWQGGMAYRVTPDGVPTALHIFDRSQEGMPGDMIVGADGNLYGVGMGGYGSPSNIFRITPSGVFTKVYVFGNIPAPQPNGTIAQAGDGSLYGVIGDNFYGYLYRVTLDGSYTEFSNLPASLDVAFPGRLSSGKDGFIYAFGMRGYQTALLRYGADGKAALIRALTESSFSSYYPLAPTQGSDGALYHADGTGTVYRFARASESTHPSFFTGETALSNGVYYLQFPNGTPFGYYSYLSDPKYIYHFDLGYEYVFDAADGKAGVYLYDFKSGSFFYTSPQFPFPYLYDFSLNTVLYYYPDPNNSGHYNTDGTRYFYNFATGKIFSK